MEDEQETAMPAVSVPFLGRTWLIPHIVLTLGAVALPFLDDAWDWSTATGAGGFFGAMVVLDLLVGSRKADLQGSPPLSPVEPQSQRSASPLVWLAGALILMSALSLVYAFGTRTGLWGTI